MRQREFQRPRSGRRGTFSELEIQDAEEEGQAHGVRNDDDDIALQEALNDPERHPRGQRQKHLEREIPGRACIPAFPQLGIV